MAGRVLPSLEGYGGILTGRLRQAGWQPIATTYVSVRLCDALYRIVLILGDPSPTEVSNLYNAEE